MEINAREKAKDSIEKSSKLESKANTNIEREKAPTNSYGLWKNTTKEQRPQPRSCF